MQVGNDIDGQIASEQSGIATGLSQDGNRIAVGSPFISNVIAPGLVRVYEQVNDTWVQLGSDIIGENDEDEFGRYLSLNGDGSIIVIGGPENDEANDTAGHVRVYQYDGSDWVQMGQDIDGVDVNERFGSAVAISADGTRIIAGTQFGRDSNNVITGDARVYEFSSGSWNQLGPDLDGSFQSEGYGRSVSMSADGTHVAAGAPSNDNGGFNLGRIEILEYNGSNWIQVGGDIMGTVESGAAGWDVNLDADGDHIAISAPASGVPDVQGTVSVFEFSGGNWSQLGNTISGTNPISFFGQSSAINATGDRVVVGDHAQGPNGLTRVFALNGATWEQIGDDIIGEYQGDQSGRSVSMNASGSRVSMGANVNSDGAINAGQARVFRDPELNVDEQNVLSFDLYPNPTDDFLNIQAAPEVQITKGVVFDVTGRVVMTLDTDLTANRINVSQLPSGFYVISLSTINKVTESRKFIKR